MLALAITYGLRPREIQDGGAHWEGRRAKRRPDRNTQVSDIPVRTEYLLLGRLDSKFIIKCSPFTMQIGITRLVRQVL